MKVLEDNLHPVFTTGSPLGEKISKIAAVSLAVPLFHSIRQGIIPIEVSLLGVDDQFGMVFTQIGRDGIPELTGGLCVAVVVILAPCPVDIEQFACGAAVCDLLSGTFLHAFFKKRQGGVLLFHIILSCVLDCLWF